MTKQAVALIAALLVVAGLLVAGCGGDDDGGNEGDAAAAVDTQSGNGSAGSGDEAGESDASAADGTTITKAEFVKQGNAICKAGGKSFGAEVNKLIAKGEQGSNQAALATTLVTDVMVPNLETEADEIRALGAPSGDEEQVEAILDGYQQEIEHHKKNPQKFQNEVDPFGEIEKPANEYGLSACPFG